jgi:Ca2+-binding RTX toxin-like protein
MTTYTVSSAAQLTTTLASAKGGDIITLASGNYGDVTISGNFSSDITITSKSALSPAIFHSLTVNDSSHITLDGLDVNATPTAATYSFSPAVSISESSNITFIHSTVTGGLAVSGIKQDGSGVDYWGNVQGLPTGYGITVTSSTGVKVDDVEVSKFYKGVVLNNSDYVTISHSDIHDTRTTPIVAGGGSHITIDSNHLHDVNPFQFGATGDHADYLAMWTNAGQASASTDIKITNNLMEQGNGQAVLGMWMQGGDAGYTNVQISGNAILAGNFQGIVLSETTGGVIDHNTLLQTSGINNEDAPSILLAVGSEKISVHDNITSAYNDMSGSKGVLANTASNNTIVQKWYSNDAGYYTDTLLKSTEALYDSLVSGGGSSTPIVVPPVVDPPVVVPPVVVTPPVVVPPVVVTPPVVIPPVVVQPPVVTLPSNGASNGSAPVETPPAGSTGGQVLNGSWDWAKLVGGSGNDTFLSKNTGDTLSGGAGDDTYNLIGGGRTLVIEAAGSGTDTVISKGDYTLGANVENLTLAPASDNWGGTGNSLNNVIKGNAGGNFLVGMAGNDTIDGGAGADYITGGVGNDRLTGGLGKDTFRFEKGSGQDVVTDFSKAQHDAIDLTAYYKLGLKATLVDVGADLKISFNTGDSITLTGIHASDLTATFSGFTA